MTDLSPEEAIRKRCQELCTRYPDVPRLRTIAAVGAYDAEIGGDKRDSRRLTKIIEYLLDCGYPIDPGFEIDVVNFREGRDFLREEKQADLVFVAYILNCRPFSSWETFTDIEKMRADPNYPVSLCTLLSYRNHERGWIDRIKEAGAKLIVTYGGKFEMGTQELGYKFASLIPTPNDECMSGETYSKKEIQAQYPMLKDIDVPMGWLGFLGDADYLKAVTPALNAETCLGRRGINPEELPEILVTAEEPVVYGRQPKETAVKFVPEPPVKKPRYEGPINQRAYRFR